MLIAIFFLICAYLVGSIPVGFYIAQWYGVADIRRYGSGTMGATNVARTLGLAFFPCIVLLDSGKAYAFLFAASFCQVPLVTVVLCAGALLLGNSYSLFLDFHGGKSVATAVGVVLFFCPHLFFMLIPVFVVALFYTKTVGIASVVSLGVLPFLGIYWQLVFPIKMLLCFISLLGIVRHKNNIVMYCKRSV